MSTTGKRLKDHNELINQKFGRLTVVSLFEVGKIIKYNVKCDCGTEKIIRKDSLTRIQGNTKSCGCLRRETNFNRGRETSFNKILWTYKNNASKRNITFDLTVEQFRDLTKLPCFYCRQLPNQLCKTTKHQEIYVYNGIDRKDNNLGYTLDNCVPCCKICNRAKRELTLNEFLDWIERLKNAN